MTEPTIAPTPQPQSAPQPTQQPALQPPIIDAPSSVLIYAHSPRIYWWVIWVYSFICAGMTLVQGQSVDVGGVSAVIYPGGWMPVSFVALVAIVLLFTNLDLRGVASYIFGALVIAGFGALMYFQVWNGMYAVIKGSGLMISGSVYFLFGVIFFFAWFVSVFIFDRSTNYRFTKDFLIETNMITGAQQAYNLRNHGAHSRKPLDFLPDFVFGLGWLGFGTRDIVVHIGAGGQQDARIQIARVWRGNAKMRQIEKLRTT
ncbi:MAG: hypothetical protein MRY74_13830 [Neomegalonema sp.]|nr:hypothetical protein [Neomegalonema sp.]